MEDEWEDLRMGLDHDQELKSRKGGARKALHSWRISAETAKRIKAEFTGYDRNKYLRMRAECRILADALLVIGGRLRKIPARYPQDIEKRLSRKDRDKVEIIIRESLAILERRLTSAERLWEQAKQRLAKHDEQRKHFAFQVALWGVG